MAGILGCSPDIVTDRLNPDSPTYDAKFREAYDSGRAEFEESIRKEQSAGAKTRRLGDPRLLIHLGKTELGQTENAPREPDKKKDRPDFSNLSDEDLAALTSIEKKLGEVNKE